MHNFIENSLNSLKDALKYIPSQTNVVSQNPFNSYEPLINLKPIKFQVFSRSTSNLSSDNHLKYIKPLDNEEKKEKSLLLKSLSKKALTNIRKSVQLHYKAPQTENNFNSNCLLKKVLKHYPNSSLTISSNNDIIENKHSLNYFSSSFLKKHINLSPIRNNTVSDSDSNISDKSYSNISHRDSFNCIECPNVIPVYGWCKNCNYTPLCKSCYEEKHVDHQFLLPEICCIHISKNLHTLKKQLEKQRDYCVAKQNEIKLINAKIPYIAEEFHSQMSYFLKQLSEQIQIGEETTLDIIRQDFDAILSHSKDYFESIIKYQNLLESLAKELNLVMENGDKNNLAGLVCYSRNKRNIEKLLTEQLDSYQNKKLSEMLIVKHKAFTSQIEHGNNIFVTIKAKIDLELQKVTQISTLLDENLHISESDTSADNRLEAMIYVKCAQFNWVKTKVTFAGSKIFINEHNTYINLTSPNMLIRINLLQSSKMSFLGKFSFHEATETMPILSGFEVLLHKSDVSNSILSLSNYWLFGFMSDKTAMEWYNTLQKYSCSEAGSVFNANYNSSISLRDTSNYTCFRSHTNCDSAATCYVVTDDQSKSSKSEESSSFFESKNSISHWHMYKMYEKIKKLNLLHRRPKHDLFRKQIRKSKYLINTESLKHISKIYTNYLNNDKQTYKIITENNIKIQETSETAKCETCNESNEVVEPNYKSRYFNYTSRTLPYQQNFHVNESLFGKIQTNYLNSVIKKYKILKIKLKRGIKKIVDNPFLHKLYIKNHMVYINFINSLYKLSAIRRYGYNYYSKPLISSKPQEYDLELESEKNKINEAFIRLSINSKIKCLKWKCENIFDA